MRLLSSLGTLLGSLLGLLGPSSGVPRAKKCRQSHAKSTFSKVFLLVSRSPFWFSWAPLGLSRARLGAQMAPKRDPKGSLKWIQKWVQKWVRFWTALGPILEPKTGSSGGHIFDAFLSKIAVSQRTFGHFRYLKKCIFLFFFAFKSQKLQFRRGHSAIFAFPENAFFYRFSSF